MFRHPPVTGAASAVIRTCIPCLLSAVASLAGAAEEGPPELRLASAVDRATVYSSGARVVRTATVELPAGRSRLVLQGLPAAFVPGSLRARIAGIDGTRIATVTYELVPETAPDAGDDAQLLARRDELDLELKEINDARALLKNKIELLRSVSVPPPAEDGEDGENAEDAEPELAVDGWRQVLDFVEEDSAAALAALREHNAAATLRERELGRVEEELKKRESRRVKALATAVIAVDSPAAGAATVELTYTVGNVAWYPSYSFTVDPTSGATEMVRYAWVAQNTGETWDDVRLDFSTGVRRRVAALPELSVWEIAGGGADGHLEPLAAGDLAPGEEEIIRPGMLAAVATSYIDNPLASRGRLGRAFGYGGDGSLGIARAGLEGHSSGALGPFMAIGAGGGGSGVFGNRRGGGKRRAVGRFGGSRGSENAVEGSMAWLKQAQHGDGSWRAATHGGDEAQTTADTALVLLGLLGAGYDHRVTSRYKDTIAKGLGYLGRCVEDGSAERDLWTLGHVATALAEALAMTADPDLRPHAQRAVDLVARRLAAAPWPLQKDLTGRVWPAGPVNLAVAVSALKSGKAAGLRVPSSAWLQAMSMVTDLDALPRTPLNCALSLYVRILLGVDVRNAEMRADVDVMLANLPRWRRGELDLRYLLYGTIAMFQHGGEAWSEWNQAVRDELVNAMNADGSWDPIGICCNGGSLPGARGSRVYATAMCQLALETYYRYLPVALQSGRIGDAPPAAEAQYIPPVISSRGRDWRDTALQRETLQANGTFKLVAVERRRLDAELVHVAVPLVYRGAFLRGLAVNTGERPLLPGEARIFLGSDYVGAVFLERVEADGELRIPLGIDGAVELTRGSTAERSRTGYRDSLVRSDYRVRIGVRNRKERPIRLLLRDRVPRPADARIRVTDVAFTPAEPDYDPQSQSGEVRFELAVPAADSTEATIAYAVEHPADIEAVKETDHAE